MSLLERDNKGRFIIGHKVNSGKKWKIKNPKLPMSEETRKKISISRKGKPSNSIGKKWSVEARLRFSKLFKGDKGHNWKGGIKPINKVIRSSIEFSLWRVSVFERDNWICQKCKEKGGKLRPHHILNFAEYPELRFSKENGITFCENCHVSFHKMYGWTNNTLQQINSFIKERTKWIP
jgi:hypothetical protein